MSEILTVKSLLSYEIESMSHKIKSVHQSMSIQKDLPDRKVSPRFKAELIKSLKNLYLINIGKLKKYI